MADEDIYGNKRKYESFMQRLGELLERPPDSSRLGRRKYYCRNQANLKYFEELHRIFESRDTSHVRRNRIMHRLLFLAHVTKKDLGNCDRRDVDEMVARAHETNRTVESKRDFLKNLRWLWRVLFPETDEQGRILDEIVPYPVRHVSPRVDRSRERRRNDKLTPAEFERLVVNLRSDVQMQAYVTLAVESLGRPQEICFTRIKDVEFNEGYARIWVSSHGKEGVKFLDCVESYPYLMKWYAEHPHQNNGDAFLFCARGESDRPLTPFNINKKLRQAMAKLNIDRTVTAYSLKRNGVTYCRLRGDSDVDIQHKAGWTSTKQLQTYDLSTREDTFRSRLSRHGLGNDDAMEFMIRRRKSCVCGTLVGFADGVCPRCKRVTDKSKVQADMRAETEMRKVLGLALENPDQSLAQIIEFCRKKGVIVDRGAT